MGRKLSEGLFANDRGGLAHLTTIPVTQVTGDLSWEELFSFDSIALNRDWDGLVVSSPLALSLALNEHHFFFAVTGVGVPHCAPDAAVGSFSEGLWHYDVVELFLGRTGAESYQELNLGPQGAWWSCLFEGYRKRYPGAIDAPSAVSVFADRSDTVWQAAIALPLSGLLVDFNEPSTIRANISAILTENSKRRYLSYAKIDAKEPDFHRLNDFCPLQLRPRHRF